MTEDAMVAIAAAVAGKTMELAAESGRKAVGKLRDLVKSKFASEPSAQAALEAAQQAPEEEQARQHLAMALQIVANSDKEFGQRLRQQWEDTKPLISAGPGSSVHSVSGTVYGTVNQVTSHGDVTIHRDH